MPETAKGASEHAAPPSIGFGRHRVKLPHSKLLRILIGAGLCLGGLLWFLPVVGLWMLPLGIMVLAIDIPAVGRLRNWAVAKWKAHQSRRASRRAAKTRRLEDHRHKK